MLHHLFDALSFWFWMTVIALFFIELIVAEGEKTGWGFVWLVVWVAGVMSLSDFNPLPWIAAHWLLTLALIVGYYVAGVLYALFRWAMLIHDPEEYKTQDYKFKKDEPKILNPNWYRDRIVSWMMWWPPSLAWYLLRWPRKIFIAAFNALSAMFQSMAIRASARIAPK
jgi:hypothetical protein